MRKLKKREFHFFASIKKLKKYEFDFFASQKSSKHINTFF